MKSFLRKLRGVVAVSITWGAVWAAVFALIVTIIGIFDPDSIDPGEGPLSAAGIGAMFGAVSGAAFALLVSAADGRRTITELSLGRAALWGFLGTALFPLLAPADNSLALVFGPIGAALAAGSVAVAKRAALGPTTERPELPR